MSKCCEKRPRLRYSSVQEVRKALHSRWPLVSGVLFIVLVAAFALWPVVSGWFSSPKAPSLVEPVSVPVDTAVLTPADSASIGQPAASTVPAKPKPARERPVQPSGTTDADAADATVEGADIDDLFRQATELFE